MRSEPPVDTLVKVHKMWGEVRAPAIFLVITEHARTLDGSLRYAARVIFSCYEHVPELLMLSEDFLAEDNPEFSAEAFPDNVPDDVAAVYMKWLHTR